MNKIIVFMRAIIVLCFVMSNITVPDYSTCQTCHIFTNGNGKTCCSYFRCLRELFIVKRFGLVSLMSIRRRVQQSERSLKFLIPASQILASARSVEHTSGQAVSEQGRVAL